MAQKLQTRAGTAANWTSANPTLLAGEEGYETDTGKSKVGDGSTAWTSLAYRSRMSDPVAAEPSVGTEHSIQNANRSTTLLVNTSTDTAGVWSAAVTAPAAVPAGATAMLCYCQITKSADTPALAVEKATGITLSDISSGSNRYKYTIVQPLVAGSPGAAMMWIPLDSNKQFKWCSQSSSATVLIGPPVAYKAP